MTTPDSTKAFDADADRTTEVAKLKAKIAELETTPDEPAQEVVTNDQNVDISNVNTTEIAGDTWHFHTPKPAALMGFGLGTSNRRHPTMMMATMQQFLGFHLLEEDYEHLIERMLDPTDEFGDEDFGNLMNAVIETANNSAEAKAPKNGPQR